MPLMMVLIIKYMLNVKKNLLTISPKLAAGWPSGNAVGVARRGPGCGLSWKVFSGGWARPGGLRPSPSGLSMGVGAARAWNWPCPLVISLIEKGRKICKTSTLKVNILVLFILINDASIPQIYGAVYWRILVFSTSYAMLFNIVFIYIS